MGDSNGINGGLQRGEESVSHNSTCLRRPIRIGNASGAIGDGLDQLYRLARDGNVDAITGDYLAEFNLAWKAIEIKTRPDLGYETSFLEQLAWNDGAGAKLVAEKRIKIVHNGGALNPQGLATETSKYLQSLGLESLKVAWVDGDNLTTLLKDGALGSPKHLDIEGLTFQGHADKVLTANAYTGMGGVVVALDNDADIVICGRCCDASPVMGLAYWWHGWKVTDYNPIAGSLMAGHAIECGAYVTGGNYCGFKEVDNLYRVGYPIAEIASDGTAIITKPEDTNGAVTVDTTKAQLLYEIQGPIYLNPDVVARIDGVRVEEIAPNRIRLSGVEGLPPPPTTKLAICSLGGYQAEISAFCVGLDTLEKFALMKSQVMGELDPTEFDVISIESYGSSLPNPRNQRECTVQIRLFAQAKSTTAIDHFRKAIFYNGMQGYCGLHVSMDWRTMEPRPFVKYSPALVSQDRVTLSVSFVEQTHKDQKQLPIKVPSPPHTAPPPKQTSVQSPSTSSSPLSTFGPTIQEPLGSLVFARSGDKGGNANIGFWVRSPTAWPWLHAFLTNDTLITLLADDWRPEYRIERCEFPNLWALNFVIYGILQDGVSSSSIIDGFGKSVGEFVRARVVELPKGLLEEERERREVAIARNGGSGN